MLPVVALVGRANVGKSTLFNRLTKSIDSLVVDLPGTTRDRKYAKGVLGGASYLLVDTGGIGTEIDAIDHKMAQQTWIALEEAELVLLVVDGQQGVTAVDEEIANQVRKLHKPIILVVNKIDGIDLTVELGDFYQLGFKQICTTAAKLNRGIQQLAKTFCDLLPGIRVEEPIKTIKVAIVGQPNVGKSTLINKILDDDRVVVENSPGTTRDSIFIPFKYQDKDITLIDTAGVRRKAKVTETIEKFSVVKALQAIEIANVVVMVIDAARGILDQDLNMLGFIVETGKALVLLVNKWDVLDVNQRDKFKREIDYRCGFIDFVDKLQVSALHGNGISKVFPTVWRAYQDATKELSTAKLTDLLQKAVTKHLPPMISGRRIKLRYAHCGGQNPQRIIIHGNQVEKIPVSYKRYLSNFFRQQLKLRGTPIVIEFKQGDNPYAGKRNTLTPRQKRKRNRLMAYHKKKSLRKK